MSSTVYIEEREGVIHIKYCVHYMKGGGRRGKHGTTCPSIRKLCTLHEGVYMKEGERY